MNPLRYGGFAVMLCSHKLARWLVPLTIPLALVGLGLMGAAHWLFAVGAVAAFLVTFFGWRMSRRPAAEGGRLSTLLAYGVASVAAGVAAWGEFLRGRRHEFWEPTRRTGNVGPVGQPR